MVTGDDMGDNFGVDGAAGALAGVDFAGVAFGGTAAEAVVFDAAGFCTCAGVAAATVGCTSKVSTVVTSDTSRAASSIAAATTQTMMNTIAPALHVPVPAGAFERAGFAAVVDLSEAVEVFERTGFFTGIDVLLETRVRCQTVRANRVPMGDFDTPGCNRPRKR
jgi:hypothetical protein